MLIKSVEDISEPKMPAEYWISKSARANSTKKACNIIFLFWCSCFVLFYVACEASWWATTQDFCACISPWSAGIRSGVTCESKSKRGNPTTLQPKRKWGNNITSQLLRLLENGCNLLRRLRSLVLVQETGNSFQHVSNSYTYNTTILVSRKCPAIGESILACFMG